jgi:hypothetical protein
MRPTGSSHSGGRLADRLRDANPVVEGWLQSAAVEVAFEGLGERIVAGEPRHRRRRSRVAVSLAFAAAMLITAAVAFGAMLTTHTGFFPAVAGTENDTSEFLRTDAPDFPQLVVSLVKGIPYPPGDSAVSHVAQYVRQVQAGPDGVPMTVQAAGIKGWFGHRAMCAWRGYWLEAHANGDTAKASLAADELKAVAASDAVAKSDSWWPKYVALAENETKGESAAPADLANWYRVNCSSFSTPWAGK